MRPKREYLQLLFFLPALLLLLLQGCRDPGSEKPGEAARSIPAVDSLILHEVQAGHIPGAVARVQQGDSVLHERAYGVARKFGYGLKPVADPPQMTTAHLFDLASLTKVCATTFAVMMLVDEGKVGLDDPVYRYLPEFDSGAKRRITVRHLLTQSAGLYRWKPTYYYARNPEERYRYLAGLPLRYRVVKARQYSDLGFMLLGDIVRRVGGRPLDRYLQERLYEPLQLEHTLFNPLSHGIDREKIAATSHGNPFERQMVYDDDFGYRVEADPASWDGWREYTLQGEVNDGNAWYTHRGVAGHAGLFSTAEEIQALLTLLLNKGQFDDKQMVSEQVTEAFLTKDRYGNGLGWAMDPEIFSGRGVPEGSFGHTGFTGTSIVVMPKLDLSIILLTNRQNVGRNEDGFYPDLGPLRQTLVDLVLARVKAGSKTLN
ncbi:MAG: serine hydrolase [Balneolaceae bacterium]|nr:serine hydrolase [Balneolaceae bacterium]